MIYKMEEIINTLRTARINKKLSQRALSTLVGLPQSHISKIESGVVDLKTSSLMEISRSLDLEPMLIPRPLVTIVKGLIQQLTSDQDQHKPAPPAYQLDEA
jgi:HTH-type transcriptional regulator / antitoxin HipB